MSDDGKKIKRCRVCAKPMLRTDVCFTICNTCAQTLFATAKPWQENEKIQEQIKRW